MTNKDVKEPCNLYVAQGVVRQFFRQFRACKPINICLMSFTINDWSESSRNTEQAEDAGDKDQVGAEEFPPRLVTLELKFQASMCDNVDVSKLLTDTSAVEKTKYQH